jgi:hypothetical protein
MKTKAIKRKEALVRATKYTYSNSRAKRLGTATQEQWEEANNKLQGE